MGDKTTEQLCTKCCNEIESTSVYQGGIGPMHSECADLGTTFGFSKEDEIIINQNVEISDLRSQLTTITKERDTLLKKMKEVDYIARRGMDDSAFRKIIKLTESAIKGVEG